MTLISQLKRRYKTFVHQGRAARSGADVSAESSDLGIARLTQQPHPPAHAEGYFKLFQLPHTFRAAHLCKTKPPGYCPLMADILILKADTMLFANNGKYFSMSEQARI